MHISVSLPCSNGVVSGLTISSRPSPQLRQQPDHRQEHQHHRGAGVAPADRIHLLALRRQVSAQVRLLAPPVNTDTAWHHACLND